MYFRHRARADREFRKAQQEGFAMLQMLAQEPSPLDAAQAGRWAMQSTITTVGLIVGREQEPVRGSPRLSAPRN
ncbi:hypothetical protein [Streptomyces kanamyceticus]|uniref:hypothetical protein n=1 Tax=Streptomyces kanamyceticus TaxID=1967 RepID=UPI0037DCA38C